MLTFVNYKGQPLPPPASNVPRAMTRRGQFRKDYSNPFAGLMA
jgi:hypothetical protein